MPNIRLPVARLSAALVLALSVALARPPEATAQTPPAKANDVARILAGLPPDAGSPLAAVTRDPGWQGHQRAMDSAWASLEKRQLSKIRAWQETELKNPQATLFYMFAGPDFLYADAFFPHATAYVLSGLETIGPIPQIAEARRHSLAGPLSQLRASINSVVSYSFFITKQMRETLGPNTFSGTLPLIYIFLARSGKTIEDVALLDIDQDGSLVAAGQGRPAGAAQAVRIGFKAADGKPRVLYYVRTDLSNKGLAVSGFMAFCDKLGRGDALVKSASYLLHAGSFATVRDFILARSARLVQDDSGIPVTYFKEGEWRLRPFGNYLGPISLFPDNYQKRLAELFRKSKAGSIEFGIGYRFRPNESNVLVAERINPKATQ